MFIGVAQGALGSKIDSLYQYIEPVLRELPNLISVYHNYRDIVQLILELLFEYTNGPGPVLCHFTQVRIFLMHLHLNVVYKRYFRFNFNIIC